MKTFSTTDLGYFINAGITEVSRIAPQRFHENVQLVDGAMDYRLRGDVGNLVANPSFESGDEALFSGVYQTVATGDDLLGGWDVGTTSPVRVLFPKNSYAKSGTHVGSIYLPAATATRRLTQNIPVNLDTTYIVSGWHWKGTAGGTGNVLIFNTLDANEVVVTQDAVRHDTTAGAPVYMSGSIIVPDDGTVAFIQVQLVAYAISNTTAQSFQFEDISVTEAGDGAGVSANSKDQIEIRRVEIWTLADGDVPAHLIYTLPRGGDNSEAGWDYWDGSLHIPYRTLQVVDPATTYLRVWGYAPYDLLAYATQTADLSDEAEEAVLTYVRVEALSRLVLERDLFTQWQTRQGNTDVSPASLMNSLAMAREDWRRRARSLAVLRETG